MAIGSVDKWERLIELKSTLLLPNELKLFVNNKLTRKQVGLAIFWLLLVTVHYIKEVIIHNITDSNTNIVLLYLLSGKR